MLSISLENTHPDDKWALETTLTKLYIVYDYPYGVGKSVYISVLYLLEKINLRINIV